MLFFFSFCCLVFSVHVAISLNVVLIVSNGNEKQQLIAISGSAQEYFGRCRLLWKNARLSLHEGFVSFWLFGSTSFSFTLLIYLIWGKAEECFIYDSVRTQYIPQPYGGKKTIRSVSVLNRYFPHSSIRIDLSWDVCTEGTRPYFTTPMLFIAWTIFLLRLI